jgi:hypothetical protein
MLLIDYAEVGDIDATCSMYTEYSYRTVCTYRHESVVWGVVRGVVVGVLRGLDVPSVGCMDRSQAAPETMFA